MFVFIPILHRGKKVREIVGYTKKTYTVKKKGKKKKVTREVPEYRTTYLPSTAFGTETYIYGVGKTEQRKGVAEDMVDELVEKLDSASLKSQIKKLNRRRSYPINDGKYINPTIFSKSRKFSANNRRRIPKIRQKQ